MDNKNKGQNPNQGGQEESQKQGRHDRKNDPVATGNNPSGKSGQGERSQGNQNTERGQQSGTGQSQRPITNQDQQRQTTNAGNTGSPMAEEETEGDRKQDERLKPYKNVGDDSEEVEKKTPTME